MSQLPHSFPVRLEETVLRRGKDCLSCPLYPLSPIFFLRVISYHVSKEIVLYHKRKMDRLPDELWQIVGTRTDDPRALRCTCHTAHRTLQWVVDVFGNGTHLRIVQDHPPTIECNHPTKLRLHAADDVVVDFFFGGSNRLTHLNIHATNVVDTHIPCQFPRMSHADVVVTPHLGSVVRLCLELQSRSREAVLHRLARFVAR